MSAAAFPELQMHDDDDDVEISEENSDDDNIALLKKSTHSNSNRRRRNSRTPNHLERKSAHNLKSNSVGSVGSATTTKASSTATSSASRRHHPSNAFAASTTTSRTNRHQSISPVNIIVTDDTTCDKHKNPRLQRSVSTASTTTVDSSTVSLGSSLGQGRLLRRRTSLGHTTTTTSDTTSTSTTSGSNKNGGPIRQCPATVGALQRPSLLEKLRQDELFRGSRGMPCPLPSIMGDSVDDSKDEESASAASSVPQSHQQQPHPLNNSHDGESHQTSSDGDQLHQTDPTRAQKHSRNPSFFQFDPSKADHLLSLVRANSADNLSIFPMQETKQESMTHQMHSRDQEDDDSSQSDEDDEDDGDQIVTSNNKKKKKQTLSAGSAQNVAIEDDTTERDPDLPPLVEPHQDSEPRLGSIFGTPWGAAFTVQSDNAGGHVVELDDSIQLKGGVQVDGDNSADDDDDDDDAQIMIQAFTMKNDRKIEKIDVERTNQEDSFEDASCASSSSDEGSEEDGGRNSHTSLLQFNHTKPDALVFASCASDDDASIFRMDNVTTLPVPVMKTTELRAPDKVKNNLNKEKRPSMFSGALAKAKSFKRAKAATPKSQSSRLPKRSASAHNPSSGRKMLETSEHSEMVKQSSDHGLVQWDRTSMKRDNAESQLGGSSRNNADKTTQSNHSASQKKTGSEKGRSRRDRTDDKDNATDENKVADADITDIDRHTSRRPRDRGETVKGRRESTRGKSKDEVDGERKERLRKRSAIRRAASARADPGRTIMEKSPKKRPGHIGHGRRRGTIATDMNNNVAKVDLDQLDLNRHEKDPTAQETKDIVNKIQLRSTMRKAQSVRNVTARPSTSCGVKKASLRRTASSQESVAIDSPTRIMSSSSRRRISDATAGGWTLGVKDREGDKDLDQSHVAEGSSKGKRKSDRRQSRNSRRQMDGEGKEDEMDRSMEKSMNSTDGERRRGGDRRHSRRQKGSRDQESGCEGMDKSIVSLEESKHSIGGSSHGNKRGSNHGGNPGSNLERIRGKHRDEHDGTANKSSTKRLNTSTTQNNESFLNVLMEEVGGEDYTPAKNGRSSSLRLERTFDASFPNLRAVSESLDATPHDNPGDADSADRRNRFTKSLSVKTFGKGARNIIVGGTRTEKKRLLDVDDESGIS